MAEVIRSADCSNSLRNARAEEIALALMGIGQLQADTLAEAATWDGAGGAVAGREAILAKIGGMERPAKVRVEQVVTHGKAGTVSGRITRGDDTRLYCHVIRFTSASAGQVAQLVSFEHPGGA